MGEETQTQEISVSDFLLTHHTFPFLLKQSVHSLCMFVSETLLKDSQLSDSHVLISWDRDVCCLISSSVRLTDWILPFCILTVLYWKLRRHLSVKVLDCRFVFLDVTI